MGYKRDQVEKWNAEMAKVPEEDKNRLEMTKQEVVALMAENIEAMRRKGYTWERVAEWLAARGMQVSAGTLRSYLRRLGHRRKRGHKEPRPTPAATRPTTEKVAARPAEKPAPAAPSARVAPAALSTPASAATPRTSGYGSFVPPEDSDVL